jgi:hypothetical protein
MLSTIRTNLKSTLEAIDGMETVIEGRSIDIKGFPACRFFLTGIEQKILTNAPDYERIFSFTVQVLQEITEKEDVEAVMQDAVEKVLNALSADWTLTDSVQTSLIGSSPVTEVEFPFGPTLVCDISLAVKTVVS